MEIFKLVFSPIRVNTYILADKSGDCAIIDCGCYDESEFGTLVNFIESKNLKPMLLLNTHSHLDHIFGNGFVLKKWGLRAFSGELDEANRKQATQHAMIFDLEMDEPPEPAGFISDNQKFIFGSTELVALFVPGHAPGSFAFYSEKNGCVFTGDALFSGSIGRTDLQGGDYDTLMESIRTKLLTLPGSTVVYAGHGSETTIEKEMKTNPYLT
jgi:hydroxyacylglutathione hydrolase